MSDTVEAAPESTIVASIADRLGMTPEPAPEKTNVVQSISERMKEVRSFRRGAPAEETPAETPKADIVPESPKPDTKPEVKPEPEDKLRAARTLSELTKVKKEALEFKEKHSALDKEYGGLKELAAKNPIKAMEKISGKSFKDIMTEAAKGGYDTKDVDPEVSAELAEIRKWRSEQETEKKTKAEQQRFEADTNLVRTFLTDNAAEFPVFSSMEWAVDSLRDSALAHLEETGEQPSLAELARDTEEKALSGLEKVLKNEKITSHPRIRVLLGKTSLPAPAAGKATLSNANAGEAPPPVKKQAVESDEITPEQVARFQSMKRGMFGR